MKQPKKMTRAEKVVLSKIIEGRKLGPKDNGPIDKLLARGFVRFSKGADRPFTATNLGRKNHVPAQTEED